MEKIVHGLLITGQNEIPKDFIQNFDAKLRFERVNYGPGTLKLFELNIIQHDELRSDIDGDEKLEALE